jgi:hypothetical protein
MATLSGNKIKDTYQSLVKFSDNGNITTSAKQLTDGFGNNSPMFVSTTQVGIGVTPESGLNLHVFGDAKIGSNLTVIGNLVVEGSTTTVGTDTLTVKDPLIVLANNNTSTDAVDIGFYGKYTPSGTTLYSGLFREALTGKYRLFKGLEVEPTTTVNTSGTGYAVATLIANLEGNVTGNLTGNVTGNITGNVTGGTISGTTGTFSGDVEVNGGDLSITSSTGLASVELGGASGGYIDIKAPESDDYDMRFIVSQGGNEITTASGDLKINTANTLALTIDSSQDATFAGGVSATTGTFSGDVNVNSNLIVTTGTPISGSANGSNVIAKIDSSAGTDSGGLEIHTGDNNGDEAALLHTNYNGDEAFRISSLGHIVSTGSASFVGQVTIPETPTADTHAASKGYVDAAVEGQDTLAEILAIGNTTGGTDIAITAGDKITNFTSTGIDDNSTSTVLTIDNTNRALFSGDVSLQANLIGNTNATGDLTILGSLFIGDYGVNDDPDLLYADNNIVRIGYYSNAKQFEVNETDFKVTATHKVGIGTNDPQTLLEVSNENSGLNPIIRLNNVDSSLSDGQNLGSIEFYNDHTNLTTANIGVFHSTDGTIVKEMKFNLGSSGDILTLDANEINATKRFTITGSGTTPRVTLTNNAGEGALTYSLRSQDNGEFGIFQESSEILAIDNDGEVFINVEDEGKFSIVSATDEAAYLHFSDGSGVKNFIRVDHDGDTFGYNSWGSHLFTLGEGVDSLTLDDNGATFASGATFSGNVGIGTPSPGRPLHVIGQVAIANAVEATSTGALLVSCDGTSNKIYSRTVQNVTGAHPIDFMQTSSAVMRIASNGNVGIGTTSPSAKFSVLESTANTEYASMGSGSTVARHLKFSGFIANGTNNVGHRLSALNAIALNVAGDDALYIDSSGNSTFAGSVTVNGGQDALTINTTDTDGPYAVWENTTNAALGYVGNANSLAAAGNTNFAVRATNDLIFAAGGNTERMRIDSSGNVGIGTDSPTNLLTINDPNANGSITDTIPSWWGLVIDRAYTTSSSAAIGLIGGTVASGSSGRLYLGNSDDVDNSYIDGGANQLHFGVGGERMRIDSSGNASIGDGGAGARGARLLLNNTGSQGTPQLMLIDSNDSGKQSEIRFDSGNLIFDYWGGTSRSERMRITSEGYILLGTQGLPDGTSVYGSAFIPSSVNRTVLSQASSSTAASVLQVYRNPNGIVGSISMTNSTTSYNTSSDYRLKENVVKMTGALDRVSQLKPSRFNFIADADKTVDGFLAHEVQEIVPEAITGEKDAMRDEEYEVSPDVYEDVVHPAEEAVYETIEHPAVEEELDDEGNVIVEGKEAYTEEVLVTEAKEEWTEKVLVSEKVMGTREVPDYQGIDQSKLVPLLVGAIQELKAEIESLKSQINN